MYKILLVEDDSEIKDIIIHYLDKIGGYETVIAESAEQALELVDLALYDLILMDILLPGMDGIELCVQIRKKLYCPIIFLSCLDDDGTIVRAMKMGGDDYLTKPFSCPVLQAHIESVLRRVSPDVIGGDGVIPLGDMTLSVQEHLLINKEEKIFLSPTEFEILLYFISNQDQVLQFEDLFRHIWKRPSYGDLRTVFSHVRNLRKKIEADPSTPRFISTIPRTGYVFSCKESAAPEP